ncbi:alpha-glucan family phosphorylase [Nitrosomonas communis]|uniref:Starch phosphorylase n=1 Tax=Nitrosomonas communis TaxID=44574 RepID=A0A1I4IR78_9PROT|nr:alpha-glucan family phosphorylase [Nitrosomonas communis]SFL56879.1 starch phosphorylase [Nitrosomonas communis]
MKMPRLVMHYLQDLPAELLPLLEQITDLATDLRWTWSHAGDEVWKTMDPQLWEQSENPFVVLQNLSRERLDELNRSTQFKQHLDSLTKARNGYCDCCGWFGEVHAEAKLKGVAYFSMEFGLGKALPLYAGGLGILAGDYLKAASDLAVPVTAIGLLYQEGYFRQILDGNGWQQEIYSYNDSSSLPLRPVLAHNGAWLHIPIELPGRTVRLQVWEARVGRVSLYLLDSNNLLNSAPDRGITSKLYGGGKEIRLVQEIILGIGGWRLIEALELEIDICHLNEGHAAFVALERARCFQEKRQVDFWEALWATRPGNIFTTHTPVAAGFDTFPRELLAKYGLIYAKKLGVAPEELVKLGRRNGQDDNEPFNMAYLAARSCGRINGVSHLHSKVSQSIFQDLYPHWPECEVPISYITNGVHVPSWDSPWADEIWTQSCGKNRWLGTEEMLTAAINKLDDAKLWTLCGQERTDLVRQARQRLRLQLSQRGAEKEIIDEADQILDPNVLTIGFARRFTAYKRPNLLLHDPNRLIRILTDTQRPVQIVVAGKAHPADIEGKRLVQQWAQFAAQPIVRKRVVFLEDYDIALAQELVQGVDVWINTPRRPWEASGTSGMKVLVNGGLNLSELDGWWAEAYTPEVGWALGDGKEHTEASWDDVEAEQLYQLLEQEIVPMFYDRDATGIPRSWVARMRASMAHLAPRFSNNRMVREYVEKLYLPVAINFQQRTAQGSVIAKKLRLWDEQLRRNWHQIHWGNLTISEEKDGWAFEVQIYLGEVLPDSIQIQLYADPLDSETPICETMRHYASIPGALNGYLYRGNLPTTRPYTDFTPRCVAYHPDACTPIENNLIHWWSGTAMLHGNSP